MSSGQTPELESRCAAIRLLVLDVDGVLSDGGIYLDDDGKEFKKFHVRDGAGIAYWHRANRRSAIISGRTCQAVDRRATEMRIHSVFQGRLDKGVVLQEILNNEGLAAEQACVIGDDIADLSSMGLAGVSVAVADAAREVREAADYVTQLPGGQGAVRELIELLLKSQDEWDAVVNRYRPTTG